MEADALLEALQATLEPEINSLKGSLSIHGHEADAVSHLSVGVDRWRVALLCDLDEVALEDGLQQAGVVTYTVRALVQHAEGPMFEAGASQWKQGASAHDVSLLRRCTQLRLLILRCQFVRGEPPEPAGDADHESGWYYAGRRTYAPAPELIGLRTYELSFRLRAGLLTPDYEGADPPLPCLLRSET